MKKNWENLFGKEFCRFDEYFFVRIDRTIISEGTTSYETLTELLKEHVKNNKTVVIDEFHGLGGEKSHRLG